MFTGGTIWILDFDLWPCSHVEARDKKKQMIALMFLTSVDNLSGTKHLRQADRTRALRRGIAGDPKIRDP